MNNLIANFIIIPEKRRRWSYAVTINGGRTVARCDTLKDAERVARSMNIAQAAGEAAAEKVIQP